MVVLAFITDPAVLSRILEHLGLPTSPPPIAPARLPIDVDLPLDELPPDDDSFDDASTITHRKPLPPAPS